MAADVGDKKDGVNGINITPLVDVCLVLVLIFMVTMPFSILRGIDVRRQSLEKYGLSTPVDNVNVRLTPEDVKVKGADGKEKAVPYIEAEAVVGEMIRQSKGKQLLLKVDRNVAHGRTVWIMDAAKQGGAEGISLLE